MGIILGVLLITGILMGCRFLLSTFVFGAAPGRRSLRDVRHRMIARQAVRDLDRKYEELLRS